MGTEVKIRELSIKRCYLPDIVYKTNCPGCGKKYKRDYGVDYVSHPPVGRYFKETMWCPECDFEWVVEMKLELFVYFKD